MVTIEPKSKMSKFTGLLQHLHNNYVVTDVKGESQEKLKVVTEVVKHVLMKMQEVDPLLKVLKPKVVLTGSVGEGLKIGKFDEVDFMIVLSISGLKMDISEIPAFVRLTEGNANGTLKTFKQYNDWFVDGYLSASKIKAWFASVLDRTMNVICVNGRIALPNMSCQMKKDKYKGPAFTFLIVSSKFRNLEVSLDFVPCLQFNYTALPQYYRSKERYFKNAPCVYAITKPPKREMDEKIKQRYWRLTFEDQVSKIFADKVWLKPTIRIFKKLKDNQGLDKILCSFYIKTITLWAIEKSKTPFWNASLGDCFLNILDCMIKSLEECKIPFFWNEKHNLIEKLSSDECKLARIKLKNLQGTILQMSDVAAIVHFFLNPQEEKQFAYKTPQFLSEKF